MHVTRKHFTAQMEGNNKPLRVAPLIKELHASLAFNTPSSGAHKANCKTFKKN